MVAQTMHGMADAGQEVSLKPDGLRGIARLLEQADSPPRGRFLAAITGNATLLWVGWSLGVMIYDQQPLTQAPFLLFAATFTSILNLLTLLTVFWPHKKV